MLIKFDNELSELTRKKQEFSKSLDDLNSMVFRLSSKVDNFKNCIGFLIIVVTSVNKLLTPLKHWVKTLTFDNGREFSWHEKLAENLEYSVIKHEQVKSALVIGTICNPHLTRCRLDKL
jgi:hypothetical protein